MMVDLVVKSLELLEARIIDRIGARCVFSRV